MKLHYVYYAIKKDGTPKVGATSQPYSRFKNYLYSKLLEAYNCPWKCGDKEIELQIKYFGKRDGSKHYAVLLEQNNKRWTDDRKKEQSLKLKKIHKNKSIGKKISKGLKDAYKNGIRKESDKSFFQTEEYKQKLRESSLKMWENSKRKEKQLKGTSHPRSVFKDDDIRYIRKVYYYKNSKESIPKDKLSSSELAKLFNCKPHTIVNIVKGRTYTSVK